MQIWEQELEQGVKKNKVWNMFKVNNKDTRTMPLVYLLSILNIFHTLF